MNFDNSKLGYSASDNGAGKYCVVLYGFSAFPLPVKTADVIGEFLCTHAAQKSAKILTTVPLSDTIRHFSPPRLCVYVCI
jgi:hypothetical protein